jgi:signal transduction histidine kinase
MLLFVLSDLLQLEILTWIVGVPLLLFAVYLLYRQYRQFRSLQDELVQLKKMRRHSIEYEMVLKAMKLAIWHVDVPTKTITFESDYRDFTDSITPPPGSLVQDVINMLEPEHQDNVSKGMADMMDGLSDDFQVQYQVRVPHGDHTYWSESYAAVDKRDFNGKPLTIVGTSQRIDRRKEMQHALQEALDRAEESDRLKSAFLANISHEIRTPLNAIVGFSDVLPMVEDEEERQHLVGLIRQNNTQLLRLFDDMVSMSKLEARADGAVNNTRFDLRPLFTELIEKYISRSQETGVTLEIVDAERLPTLTTDRDRLREILNQYVNNALKFTTEGKVSLGCTVHNDKVRIWVRDTGKGIPEEWCNEKLFERFVKIDEFVSGTGLGLSICRRLAQMLKGEVGVESKLGEGSVFWVQLNDNN